jgi:hypothetical protein
VHALDGFLNEFVTGSSRVVNLHDLSSPEAAKVPASKDDHRQNEGYAASGRSKVEHNRHTPASTSLEEALTVLFCLLDDVYQNINPNGRRYESLNKLSDPEVITLAFFQQHRGLESQRSFLRDAESFILHLFPGVAGLHPSSFHRRVRKLRRFLESLRRAVVVELVGDPETLLIDSTLLSVLHPRQVPQWGASTKLPLGEVGLLLRLRDQAPPLVRNEQGACLL